MVFRRRTSRKTIRRKGRKTLAKKVKRVSKIVTRISRGVFEKKVYDQNLYSSNVYTPDTSGVSGAYRLIPFNVAQGDTIGQRQGQKIMMKYLQMYYTLEHPHQSTGNTCSRIRVLVVMDKSPQNASASFPTYGDIVQGTSIAQQWPLAYPDINQGFVNKRFKFLYDRTHDLIEFNSIGNTYPTSKSQTCKKVLIPLNKIMTFQGTGAGVHGKNWIYVFVWSDQVNTGTIASPILTMYTRAVFLDN